MGSTFILIIALIMPNGELSLASDQVEACPAKETLAAYMEDLKSTGQIKEWDANCVEVPAQGMNI